MGGWMVCMRDKTKGVGLMSRDDGGYPESEEKTLVTPDHTAVQVGSSG